MTGVGSMTAGKNTKGRSNIATRLGPESQGWGGESNPKPSQGLALRTDRPFVDIACEEAWLSAQARGQRSKDVLFSITSMLLAAFGVVRTASGAGALPSQLTRGPCHRHRSIGSQHKTQQELHSKSISTSTWQHLLASA